MWAGNPAPQQYGAPPQGWQPPPQQQQQQQQRRAPPPGYYQQQPHALHPHAQYRQPPPPQQQQQQQQQQPVYPHHQPQRRQPARRSDDSEFFRGQFDSEMRTLTAHPEHALISSLSQHAQEHLGNPPNRAHGADVIDVVQRRIGAVRARSPPQDAPPPPRARTHTFSPQDARPIPITCRLPPLAHTVAAGAHAAAPLRSRLYCFQRREPHV